MAEEIVLSGQFRDNITPQLKKLSRELNNVSKSFTKIQKKLRPITKEMGTLAMASERVANALKAQKSIIDQNARSWSNYKTEVGRAGAAQRRAFQGAPKGGTPAPGLPRIVPGAAPPAGGTGPGTAAVAGGVLGVTLSNIITNAVVSGFQLGSKIIMEPFRFLINGLGERIQDEMSDVRAAGGLFAISRRMEGGGFVNNFAEAEALTKEQNRYLAQLAGALPGDTQEYIQVAKQISDGIYTVIAQDRDNAVALGQELAKGRGADLAKFEQGGIEAMQAAGKEIVGEMTKLTVLAGLGGQKGAFGLPQLTEQMIARDEVTMGQFQRYSAIFRDPMIKGALERNIDNINATGKNTTARLEAIRKVFQEVVTPELVRRYQRTTSGTLEALRTTFLNPEVGLLGLGRPLSVMAKKFDEFGNAVEKNGKVVEEALSIFDYLRDIFANVMIVLQPVIDAAVNLFDPFTELGNQLNRLRDATMLFQNSFERYRKGLQNIANGLEGEAKTTFESTLTLRASLAAINNAFANLGVYGDTEFLKLANILKDPTAGMKEFQKIIQDMVTEFLNSEGAKKIGEAIGGIIGSVVSTVGNILAQIAGIATAGPLAEGFNKGFVAAGGKEGIQNIIKSVFNLIGKAIVEVFKAAPFEVSLVAGLVLFGPAIAAALGTALVGAVTKMGSRLILGKGAAQAMQGAGGAQRPARLGATPFISRRGAATARLARKRGKSAMTGMVQSVKQTKAVTQLGKAMSSIAKVAKPVTKFAKAIPGGALAVGAIDAGIRLAAGENAGKAIGGAASSAIGATLGGILGQALIPIPGVGAALGAVAGGFLGDSLFQALMPETEKQAIAAEKQLEAAKIQSDLARAKGVGATGVDIGATAAFTADPMKLQEVINSLGLASDENARALVSSTQSVRFAQDTYNTLNNELYALMTDLTKPVSEGGKGFSEAQAKANGQVKSLTSQLATARGKLKTVQEKLNTDFAKLPDNVQIEMVDRINTWTPVMLEAAIANMVKNATRTALSGVGTSTIPFQAFSIPQNTGTPTGNGGSVVWDPEKGNFVVVPYYKGNFDTPLGRQLKEVGFAYGGSLGEAISTEMKHKPPGSNLVIANSSETIIPAYAGHFPEPLKVVEKSVSNSSETIIPAYEGNFPEPLKVVEKSGANSSGTVISAYEGNFPEPLKTMTRSGDNSEAMSAVINAVQTSAQKTTIAVTKLTEPIKTGASEIKTEVDTSSKAVGAKLGEISGKLTSPMKVEIVASIPLDMKMSIAGGLGGATGGPAVLNPLAQQFGLIMTSGYRPNDTDSYHGIDRARDYAGDPQQMMAYAQTVAGLFGGTLKELIYTPLGYSIKDGQVVPPYAQGTHYDHVHVAYAMGQGQPAFFSSQDEAVKWEKMMAPRDSAIKSITTNSSEIGGDKVYNQSVTVNIDGRGINDEDLGNRVAEQILTSMRRASYAELDLT